MSIRARLRAAAHILRTGTDPFAEQTLTSVKAIITELEQDRARRRDDMFLADLGITPLGGTP